MGLDDRTTPLQYMIPCPSDGAEICKNCRYYGSVTTTDTRWYCVRTISEVDPNSSCEYWKTAKQTNADRIRSMTDEELEQWLTAFVCSNVAPHATARGAAKKGRLLEWLKEEVKDV